MCVVVSKVWVGGNRLWLESQKNQIYIVSVSHVEVILNIILMTVGVTIILANMCFRAE